LGAAALSRRLRIEMRVKVEAAVSAVLAVLAVLDERISGRIDLKLRRGTLPSE
jgi:hypothetical protein